MSDDNPDILKNLRNTCRILMCIDEAKDGLSIVEISNITELTTIQVTAACHGLRRKFKISAFTRPGSSLNYYKVRTDELSIDPRKDKCTHSRSPVAKMCHANSTGKKLKAIAYNLEDKIELLEHLRNQLQDREDILTHQMMINDYMSLRVTENETKKGKNHG